MTVTVVPTGLTRDLVDMSAIANATRLIPGIAKIKDRRTRRPAGQNDFRR